MQELVREYLNELGKKQKKRRWVNVVAAVLAVFAVGGVIWGLSRAGIATTGEVKCGKEEHVHTDACYSNVLTCGQEESAGHQHTDACYRTESTLVCGQEESDEHQHMDACYQTTNVLVCGQEESAGHQHTDACYTRTLTCGKEEHQHTEACYIDANADVEDASKWTAQYENIEWKEAWGQDLVIAAKEQIGYKESVENYIVAEDGSHKGYTRYGQFAGDRYIDWDASFVNFCMYYAGLSTSEMFPNEKKTTDWYKKFVEAEDGKNKVYLETPEDYEPKEGDIIFTKRENEESELQMGIVSSYDKEKQEVKVIEGNSENQVKENIYAADDKYISEYLKIGEMEQEYKIPDMEVAAGAAETEETSEDSEADESEEAPAGSIEKVFTSGEFVVTASYNEDAEIPEEAELIVEQITAEENEEHYAERENEFRETLEDEKAVMRALLKIGFYVNGEEVEPKSTVTIKVQFLDENGLAEGKPVTVVHFAEHGAEVLDGSDASDNSTTFSTESFSEFAIGEEAEALAKGEAFPVNKEFLYEDNNLHVKFHIVGNAREKLEKDEAEKTVKEEDALDLAEEGESRYRLQVNVLDKTSEIYKKFAEYADEMDNGGDRLVLQAMDYSLFYDETELDLTDCKVTIEITPTATVNKEAQELMEQMESEIQTANNAEAEEKEVKQESVLGNAMVGKRITSVFDNVAFKEMKTVLGAGTTLQNEEKNAELLSKRELADVGVVFSVYKLESLTAGGAEEEAGSEEGEAGEIEAGEIEEDNALIPKDTLDNELPSIRIFSAGGPFAAEIAGIANPKFDVEYYAYLDRMVTTQPAGTDALPVIDTTGRNLPANGGGKDVSPTNNAIKNLYVESADNSSTTKRMIKTETLLTEVYRTRQYSYWRAPSINYFDALIQNSSYNMVEVWVYNQDGTATSGETICGKSHNHEYSCYKANWTVYTDLDNLHFANRKLDGYVWIQDGTKIRLVYNMANPKYPDIKAAFYDYDLSNGYMYTSRENAISNKDPQETGDNTSGTWFVQTNQKGINLSTNYTGRGTKLAFGNANTASGLQNENWNGNLLNQSNKNSYKGCTFGLTSGLDENKQHIVYANDVSAPKLFNDGNASGKTSYDKDQYSLKFIQTGDTYTLSAVNGTSATELEKFNHPSPYSGKTHNHIWTNNFWPMDSAASYGTTGHDMKFGSYANKSKRNYVGASNKYGTFPESDDGLDHNAYFGMHYQVDFNLSAEYVGPLEYYFFGDDDMWVFLDGELVCDIGGVHSSVGEYVNLWDYIKDTDEYKKMVAEQEASWASGSDDLLKQSHTLSFFYTERGESGSTCWMQFTLPSVTSASPATNTDYGQLKIGKTVTQIEDGKETPYGDNNQDFTFEISLDNAQDDYVYRKYKVNPLDGEATEIIQSDNAQLVLHDGSEFTLKHDEYIVIDRLPIGTTYTVTETTDYIDIDDIHYSYGTIVTDENNNETVIKDGALRRITGTITKKADEDNNVADNDINRSEIAYNNRFTVYHLPATGGSGIYLYMFSGVVLISAASLITYRKKRKGVSGS